MALMAGHDHVVAQLIDAHAGVNFTTPAGTTAMLFAKLDEEVDQDSSASLDGVTLLHVAVQFGSVSNVTRLIDAGADINRACMLGVTPLYAAARDGRADIVAVLSATGADIDRRCSKGETALYVAAELGNDDVLSILLDAGADVDAAAEVGLL
ncbi:hypothetical protein ACHHYP_20685 [Achlya hypogyna]|uniref:Uncharacterized protein n=1 Tax=Achlya hypogyna TaxID=1202772 RepID=A0A1V9YF23_ACHHY|nr:hypothetical protein ACHHYP_20685 [Achlya hypogyna]